jgi:hypothetical protein
MKPPVITVGSDDKDKDVPRSISDADTPAVDHSSPVTSEPTIDGGLKTHHEITVTPAFPNFSTNEERPDKSESTSIAEELNDVLQEESSGIPVRRSTSRLSQRSLQLVDELRYLLKPTNSLASPSMVMQTSVRLLVPPIAHDYLCRHSKKPREPPTVDRSISTKTHRTMLSDCSSTVSHHRKPNRWMPHNAVQSPHTDTALRVLDSRLILHDRVLLLIQRSLSPCPALNIAHYSAVSSVYSGHSWLPTLSL